jgi:hypothetical protein
VLHPTQFSVNEAWIVFKLNDAPIRTEKDGDFDFIAVMDAASCFIVCSVPVPVKVGEPTKMEAKRLLRDGKSRQNNWPKTLFIPTDQPAEFLAIEGERHGITVIRVPEDQLMLFIGEAREGFREQFGGAR